MSGKTQDSYNFEVKDVNTIHAGWPIKQVGDFTSVTSGGTPSTKSLEYWGGNIKWMNSGELNLKRVCDVEGRITNLGLINSSTRIIPENSVLIGLAGQGRTRGTTAINYVNLCINQSIAAIYPSEVHDSEYLYQNLDYRYDELRSMSTGDGGRGGLNLKIIRRIPIPLPSLNEQKAIAEVLSDTDNIIISIEKLIDKKEKIKRGAMQQLLTGEKRLPGFNDDWQAKKIAEFTSVSSGGTPSTNHPEYWNGHIRWMNSGELNLKRVYEVEGRITNSGLNNSSTKLIPSNSVLIGLAGQGKTRGTASINYVELCINQSIAAILPSSLHSSEYLYQNIDYRYNELRTMSTGDGGRGGLNLKIIRNLIIPFPSLDEQKAIAQVLSDMDTEIAVLEEKVEKYKEIKQGMMQELLTGRIRMI